MNNDKQKPGDKKKEKTGDTDPQEKMEGPVSSIMQEIKEEVEENDAKDAGEASEKDKENS